VPAVADAPNALTEIEEVFAHAAAHPPRAARAKSAPGTRRSPTAVSGYVIAPALRSLTIVAGKGGVGKTTVACAIAVSLARPEAPILIVSSDPAPSVADALRQTVPDDDIAVDGGPGCYARQMDASAAFERFRDTYSERVDAVFDRLTGGSLNLTHDRAVMRDLLALAPPGIDELYALVALGELLAGRRYASIIVDPAPTGHLLRLLEMPSLALSWTHRLMRVMLEYKEVGGLGDAAGELLDFARRTRSLRELMGDPSKTTALVVSNDEPLVRAETIRLLHACRDRGIEVGAIIWNRAERAVAPLSDANAGAQFEAPATVPSPRGAPELRAWCASWRPLDETSRA
jgi:arsenite-transporting ATPase